MVSLGNGNSWRQRGNAFDPVERGDVSVDAGVSEGEREPCLSYPWEFVEANHDFVKLRSLCKGCYCDHTPACPPCECAFHNPNVL